MLLIRQNMEAPTMFARIGVMRALNACSIRRGKKSIGDAASWRGISKFVVYRTIVAKARSPRNVND